ncbi:sensor histidine kinase [Spirochaeta lutea]|uniref:histidine kinase n=1 Tax=Spirochaeta lutea TaxID=1480694 RepID=A0A098R3W0_9SPIO|nr:histidine kinase dimerization/phosphoacceptor domain -containing protein [Spirochaeta lutea]KGE73407.1 hypothetical protein DC28_03825 [Spirochaeta lutea]
MAFGWNRSLGLRFILMTSLIIVGVGIFVSVLEGVLLYDQERRRVDQEIFQVQQSHLPSLVSSLWLTDWILVQQQAQAIERFPSISRVEVENDQGEVFSAGAPVQPEFSVLSEELTYFHREQGFPVGMLRIYQDPGLVEGAVLGRVAVSLGGHMLILLTTGLWIALLFHHQVGKYLTRLAVLLKQDDREHLEAPLDIRRRRAYDDELGDLLRAINLMRHNLSEDMHQRELRIAEIHHRMKNDLSFIYSLLYLQSEQVDQPRAREQIVEAGRRVGVISQIYSRLYTERNFLEVSVKPLVEQMVVDLVDLGVISMNSVTVDMEDIRVPTKVSIGIGIAVNELVTNAVKYAGMSGEELRVQIALRSSDPGVNLEVRDNGAGFSQDLIQGQGYDFGLRVIQSLSLQHSGEMTLSNEDGGVVRVGFGCIDRPDFPG